MLSRWLQILVLTRCQTTLLTYQTKFCHINSLFPGKWITIFIYLILDQSFARISCKFSMKLHWDGWSNLVSNSGSVLSGNLIQFSIKSISPYSITTPQWVNDSARYMYIVLQQQCKLCERRPGGRLIIKMLFYQYRDPMLKIRDGLMTILSPYLGKTVFVLTQGRGNHQPINSLRPSGANMRP